ncbi:hypothetical protein RE6C_03914 [Rhodopirellula europaea 6C]|uniref:Uncharacterized protein n=1 Tax=Rhodopirellula europaea 6C TaxID=1263867 RepID=M2B0R0_9BACT|nr:hypothetical protein RE6C_03914 [Rhodopirellula europaea 6C]
MGTEAFRRRLTIIRRPSLIWLQPQFPRGPGAMPNRFCQPAWN